MFIVLWCRHGLANEDAQWYDGVPGITQCAILPGKKFTVILPVSLLEGKTEGRAGWPVFHITQSVLHFTHSATLCAWHCVCDIDVLTKSVTRELPETVRQTDKTSGNGVPLDNN